jgi:hypothetical protein
MGRCCVVDACTWRKSPQHDHAKTSISIRNALRKTPIHYWYLTVHPTLPLSIFLQCSAASSFNVASMSRVIYRVPSVVGHLALFAPASTGACLGAHRVFGRHNIHTTSSQVQAFTRQASVDNTQINEPPSLYLSHQKADIPPGWRHPLWGFTALEASQIISIDVSPSATESDVNTLLDRANIQR